MRISEREIILAAITLAALLIGITFLTATPVLDDWKRIEVQIEEAQRRLQEDKSLIEQRSQWEERFVKLSKLMPEFSVEEKMDTHWLSVMDQIAAKNGVIITKRQLGERKQMGDIQELSIEVREWEGTLDALVHFLFDLQNLGAKHDIKTLYVKPLQASKLRCRFTLNCAFSQKFSEEKTDESQ